MLTISDIAAKHLDRWLSELMGGELQLWQLPAPVRAFYHAGFAEGLALNTQTQRITQLEHECDRLYMAAFTPKERRAHILALHQARTDFEWPLFENALINLMNSSVVAPVRAEVERTHGTSQGTRQAA